MVFCYIENAEKDPAVCIEEGCHVVDFLAVCIGCVCRCECHAGACGSEADYVGVGSGSLCQPCLFVCAHKEAAPSSTR